MDILYLVGPQSTNNYQDLRYSLRSIAKNGMNIDRVFVCGCCPDFLSDEVIKLEYLPDQSLPKNKKIFSQLLYAVYHTDIGVNHKGEFLLSMDDHIYVRKVDFDKYPFYVKNYTNRHYRYLLPNHLDYTKMSVDYQKILVNTYHFCVENELNILNFVPHRNMHMNRNVFLNMMNDGIIDKYMNDPDEIEGLVVTLNYRLRYYPFKYELCNDIKMDNPSKLHNILIKDKNIHCFSMNDFKLGSSMDRYLMGLFPNMCKYERHIQSPQWSIDSDGSGIES